MKIISYKIEGLNCNHCVATVNKALKNCAGVLDVVVSLEREEANLKIDETKFDIAEAKSAVLNAGQYELIS